MAVPPFDPKPKLVTLCVKPIKTGAKVVRHGRYNAFQLAEAQYHEPCSLRSWPR
jgi:hypothetical protein